MQKMTDRHSFEQIASVDMLLARNRLSVNEALFAATQLVVHGSEAASKIISNVRNQVSHPDVQQYLDRLSKQEKFIRGIPGLSEIRENKVLRSELYQLDNVVFRAGEQHREKLLVVFTTMFNNFYVSNLVLYALLRNFGVSVLFLKDSSLFNYLKGVVGFGSDIMQVSQNVLSLARREGISEIYLTGFSSGGYASLYSSCLLPCSAYLGFSVVSDLSGKSAIYPGKFFTDDVRAQVDPKWLINLRHVLLASGNFPRRDIFFGNDHNKDAEQARNLEGIRETKIIGLRDCGHQTIAALMESNSLTNTFQSLFFEFENMSSNLSKG
jgi:hypothetical protein